MRDSGRKCEISGSIIGKLPDPAAGGEAGGFFEVAVEEGVVFEAEEFADLVDCVLAALEETFGFEDYVFGDQGGGRSIRHLFRIWVRMNSESMAMKITRASSLMLALSRIWSANMRRIRRGE